MVHYHSFFSMSAYFDKLTGEFSLSNNCFYHCKTSNPGPLFHLHMKVGWFSYFSSSPSTVGCAHRENSAARYNRIVTMKTPMVFSSSPAVPVLTRSFRNTLDHLYVVFTTSLTILVTELTVPSPYTIVESLHLLRKLTNQRRSHKHHLWFLIRAIARLISNTTWS